MSSILNRPAALASTRRFVNNVPLLLGSFSTQSSPNRLQYKQKLIQAEALEREALSDPRLSRQDKKKVIKYLQDVRRTVSQVSTDAKEFGLRFRIVSAAIAAQGMLATLSAFSKLPLDKSAILSFLAGTATQLSVTDFWKKHGSDLHADRKYLASPALKLKLDQVPSKASLLQGALTGQRSVSKGNLYYYGSDGRKHTVENTKANKTLQKNYMRAYMAFQDQKLLTQAEETAQGIVSSERFECYQAAKLALKSKQEEFLKAFKPQKIK